MVLLIIKMKVIFFNLFIIFLIIESKITKEPDLSYLQIFRRPSFRDIKNNIANDETSKLLNIKKNVYDDKKSLYININNTNNNEYIKNNKSIKFNKDYDYPVNIFKKAFFILSRSNHCHRSCFSISNNNTFVSIPFNNEESGNSSSYNNNT